MNRDESSTLELRVLGPIELWREGTRVALPRSKKTRALLAYLATTGRPHRREQLCNLLWEMTEDPRGALRWSLSRLRRVLEDHVEADRLEVSLRAGDMSIDAHRLSRAVRGGMEDVETDVLEAVAGLSRGTFLEGLDLPDLMAFNAWCIAERERFREEHCLVLSELVRRLPDDPERALPHARARVQADAFSVAAQEDLLRVLVQAGKSEEARQRFDNARRLYREVGAPGVEELARAWRGMSQHPGAATRKVQAAPAPTPQPPSRAQSMWPFVGRQDELAALQGELDASREGRAPRLVVITGEPGSGKSRLAERFTARAASAGLEVVSARAYEAESSRPYGPWVDALGLDLQALVSTPSEEGAGATRESLFVDVAARVAQRTREAGGLVLVLDDLQWLDPDSAELLHFVVRTHRDGNLLLMALARGGELGDNEAVSRALRGIRREGHVEEIALEPLGPEEIGALVGQDGADATGIYEASAGNPLYAIELARARAAGVDHVSTTLLQLVRERVEQLPDHAADVLRWGAILGHALDVERLEAISSLSLDELVDALERLEHNALLRIDATRARQRYVFSHDVVREAVYGQLSHPRRRLMHRKVAQLLEPRMSDVEVATEVAHHAGLGGEALLGVRACVVAGNQSLRVFANADAEALARRGLRLAADLPEEDRIRSTLDLLRIQYSAHTPDREAAAQRVRELAERALDLGLTSEARLGFQMLSFLRWESSSMEAAHTNIMQAERVSRSGGPDERAAALAQAAKCLVLLERNLGQAEAFVMEADALVHRSGRSSSAVAFASGMIAAHRGDLEDADRAFREAAQLARAHGERLAEFLATEHLVMLEIDRGTNERALELAEDLADLGERVRPGAEAPAGRGLRALVRHIHGRDGADADLRAALEELRTLDAKYEQAFLLTRWARHELERGNPDDARVQATAALEVASAIGRPSEKALAHALLARCAEALGESETHGTHIDALRDLRSDDLSRSARQHVEGTLGADPPAPSE